MAGLDQLRDIELIERCKEGDEGAFETLYHRYRLPLFSYLNSLVPGNAALVDDVFQQTWCKVLKSWSKYSDEQRFLAWACRIAHNLVMDHFRRSRNWKEGELSDGEALATGANSHEELVDKELQEALETAIEALSAEQREVVEYRRAGVSFQSIADTLGVSINTVLGRMHYAVKRLRSILHEHLV